MLKNLLNQLRDLLAPREVAVPIKTKTETQVSSSPPPQEEPPPVETPPDQPFTVYVDDNYHYMDDDSRYKAGEFDTWEEAVTLAKKIVDETVVQAINNGATPEEAYKSYVNFGEDPWIASSGSVPEDARFSAWSYARERCQELYRIRSENCE